MNVSDRKLDQNVSDRKLDQLRLGELDEAEEREVLDALEEAGEMHRLDAMIDVVDAYQKHYPPEVAIAEIHEAHRRTARNQPQENQMAPRPFAVLGFVGTAAVVALAGWWGLDPFTAQPSPPPQVVAERAAAAATDVPLAIEQWYVEAERHDREDSTAIAAEIYGRIADEYALKDNPGVYLQSVLRRGLFEHAKGDREMSRERFERVIELHALLDEPTALGTDAAAQAQFMLGERAAVAAVAESLNEQDEAELNAILERKSRAAQRAEEELERVIAYDRARWSIAAHNRIGTLYREFSHAIRSSVIPERLSAAERERYRAVLDQSARNVEQHAVKALQKAIALSEHEGITTADTGAARVALAQLEADGVGQRPTGKPETDPMSVTYDPSHFDDQEKKQLSRNDVKKTINSVHASVRKCGELRGPGGTVKVKFYIQPSGKVRDAEIVATRHKNTAQGQCVRKTVAQLKFPAFDADKDVPVTYPFVLPKKAPTAPQSDDRSSGGRLEFGNALHRRGLAEMIKGNYRKAIERSNLAMENGCTKKCYRLSGMAHHKLGESEAACRWLKKAGSELPDDLVCD